MRITSTCVVNIILTFMWNSLMCVTCGHTVSDITHTHALQTSTSTWMPATMGTNHDVMTAVETWLPASDNVTQHRRNALLLCMLLWMQHLITLDNTHGVVLCHTVLWHNCDCDLTQTSGHHIKYVHCINEWLMHRDADIVMSTCAITCCHTSTVYCVCRKHTQIVCNVCPRNVKINT